MSPDDRRAALVKATLPLLSEFGLGVTSRQIADAAGVAEGTIFRVFPDKTALFLATAIHALTPHPHRATFESIDKSLALRGRLIEAATFFTEGMTQRGRLQEVLHDLMSSPETGEVIRAHLEAARQRALTALIGLMEPDAHRLRVSLPAAARIMLVLIFSTSHVFGEIEPLSSEELVTVLLDGLLVPTSDVKESSC